MKKKAYIYGNQNNDKIEDIEKFEYLLHVLDSLERRKLHCTARFYNSILFQGSYLGGLHKKIASIIQKARTDSLLHLKVQVQMGQAEGTKSLQVLSWIDLLKNYSEYRDTLDRTTLPPVRVRINENEIRQVLSAEQSVTYNAMRRGKKNTVQSRRR